MRWSLKTNYLHLNTDVTSNASLQKVHTWEIKLTTSNHEITNKYTKNMLKITGTAYFVG